jgi:hypothetical protein
MMVMHVHTHLQGTSCIYGVPSLEKTKDMSLVGQDSVAWRRRPCYENSMVSATEAEVATERMRSCISSEYKLVAYRQTTLILVLLV